MDYLLVIMVLYLSWGLVHFLLYLANRSKPSTTGTLPPGPRPLPVIGNILELGSLPHRSLARLASSYGPVMSLKLGSLTSIVVSSAPMAREILQTHDATFSDRHVTYSLTSLRHDEFGLPWLPICPLWRNLRRISHELLFATKTLDSSQNIRSQKIKELLNSVRKCSETRSAVDIGKAGSMMTLNVLGSTILSIDLSDPTSELANMFKYLTQQIMEEMEKPNMADYFPVLKRIDPQGAKQRMASYLDRLFHVLDRIIKDRVQEEAMSSVKKDDMLDRLLDLSKDESKGIMDQSLMKHLLAVLFVAGKDTISCPLEWAMAELLCHPGKLSKVQAELKQVIGMGKPIEESDIARLPYLQAAVKETYRMHPPAPLLLPRRARATTQVGGYTVPEGAQILVNVWAIGRDPATWENPEEFIPERFLGKDIDVKGQNFELLPFGGGRRICPGLPLATKMLHVMLGSLLNCFDWKLEDGVASETMDMGDKFGFPLRKAQPLRVLPLPIKE